MHVSSLGSFSNLPRCTRLATDELCAHVRCILHERRLNIDGTAAVLPRTASAAERRTVFKRQVALSADTDRVTLRPWVDSVARRVQRAIVAQDDLCSFDAGCVVNPVQIKCERACIRLATTLWGYNKIMIQILWLVNGGNRHTCARRLRNICIRKRDTSRAKRYIVETAIFDVYFNITGGRKERDNLETH